MNIKNNIRLFAKKFKFTRHLWHFYQSFVYFIKHPFPEHNKKNRDGVVVQLLTTFVDKDAIGNAAIEISKALDNKNIKNYIVYEGAHSYIKNGVPVTNFKFNKKDIIIYHMSIGCNASNIYKNANVKKKIMNYHNITPAKYFYDMPQEKKMAELGRKQLIELKECTDLAVCDSKFNESELKEIGYKNTCVVPIPTKIGDLLKLRTKKIREKIKKIITVGRIARNKCIEDVIKVFSEYHKLNQNSRLDIIGNCDNKQYAKELCDLVNKLNINESVFFRGSLTPKQLAWYYSNADVYLCMSEHEGFCVPILEALAFNLKVIAARNTALIETVGKFGALVDKTNYANVAMLIDSNHKYNNFKFDDKNKYDINLIFDGC